jgi:hypothetical protein
MSKIGKNRENIRKIAFFYFFPYALHHFFNIFVLRVMITIFYFVPQNKNLKKPKKKLLKLFLKNEKWTFIFVHISKLKKSFKK